MSRLGKTPIAIPQGVKVQAGPGSVHVEGPKGKLDLSVPVFIQVKVDGGKAVVSRLEESRRSRAMHGTIRAHLANMVKGVVTPFEEILEISGAGFGAKVAGTKLVLTLGFTHPIEREIPAGLTVESPQPVVVHVKGADRQKVGQFAAELRRLRPVDVYKQKGVRYRGEPVRKKAGKAAVGVAK